MIPTNGGVEQSPTHSLPRSPKMFEFRRVARDSSASSASICKTRRIPKNPLPSPVQSNFNFHYYTPRFKTSRILACSVKPNGAGFRTHTSPFKGRHPVFDPQSMTSYLLPAPAPKIRGANPAANPATLGRHCSKAKTPISACRSRSTLARNAAVIWPISPSWRKKNVKSSTFRRSKYKSPSIERRAKFALTAAAS